MKTIGLLGGMSWESTASYYQILNERVKARLGGLHSAKISLISVDFGEIEPLMRTDDWDTVGRLLSLAAKRVEAGGADLLLICTNTMHKIVSTIESAVTVPVLHIADATAERLVADGIRCVGLLGTRFTMEQDFLKGRIAEEYGIEVRTPDASEMADVHRVIFEELCRGEIREASRTRYLEIIGNLANQGAEAVVLGCTEIALLVRPEHCDIPLYDTTTIHAEKAVEIALA